MHPSLPPTGGYPSSRPRSRPTRRERIRRPAATRALLDWYARNARRFAWRGRRRPYAIWVSEVMLQQTRATTVGPYYRRWMKRFPSLRSLASAPRREVLRLWEGLGYYRRAHHLHQAAREIVRRFRGRFPCQEHAGY